MVNRPKDIGTRFTSDVIRYLMVNGFPHAELRNQAGEHDKGDIIGLVGVAVECKGGKAAETASDNQIKQWLLVETERERQNARADVGILITKRPAIGAANAGNWWAHMTLGQLGDLLGVVDVGDNGFAPVRMHLSDAVALLRSAGYGDPL